MSGGNGAAWADLEVRSTIQRDSDRGTDFQVRPNQPHDRPLGRLGGFGNPPHGLAGLGLTVGRTSKSVPAPSDACRSMESHIGAGQ
jgi:hypothetical protein